MNYNTAITLFDDADDDAFDGTLGQDDDEDPMLCTQFFLSTFYYSTNASPRASPRRARNKRGLGSADGSVSNANESGKKDVSMASNS